MIKEQAVQCITEKGDRVSIFYFHKFVLSLTRKYLISLKWPANKANAVQ